MQSEIKSVDTQIEVNNLGVVNNVYTTASILLNAIKTGSQLYNRVGINVYPRAVRVRMVVAPIASNSWPGPFCRIAVVYDRSPDGANPADFFTIFLGYDTAGAEIKNLRVSPNPSYIQRFTIIRDNLFQLGFVSSVNGVALTTSPAQKTIDDYIKLNTDRKTKTSYVVEYKSNSNAGTQADISTGAFLLVMGCSSPPNTMTFNGSVRFTYTDKS